MKKRPDNYHELDYLIPVEVALKKTDGNQAALGRILGVKRAAANSWKSRDYLPSLAASRFVRKYGASAAVG